MYYDHYGERIVNLFDQYGSFGLSESITNPTNLLTPDTSPRFTGIHDLPNITGMPASTISYPALAPNDPLWTGFEIAHGLDDPYENAVCARGGFFLQRELPGAFIMEIAYIGRFGRHELQQIDLAQPLDLVDPQSGQDYFSAATQLSKQQYAGVKAANIAKIPYFENMFPDAAGSGLSATQNILQYLASRQRDRIALHAGYSLHSGLRGPDQPLLAAPICQYVCVVVDRKPTITRSNSLLRPAAAACKRS